MNWAKAIKTIQEHKTFLVTTHIHPDADALASQLAMALYLKGLGKKVHIIHAEHVPARFDFIPAIGMIRTFKKGERLDYDAAVVLDCGDLNRMDKVKSLLHQGKVIVNIDHHVTNDFFGTLNYVDPKASSTAEVLFDFFKKSHFQLTKNVAVLLYLGIMTDTGSFRYDSTSAHTHLVASELMRFKFSVSDLYRKMYERIPLHDLKLLTKVINRFERLYDGRVVCIEMRKKTMEQFSPEFDVRDKIFTFLRAIKGVEVIIILTEQGSKVTRANFRSQGDRMNVADLASFFRGGGHRKASGCTIPANLKEAKKQMLAQLKKIYSRHY